MFPGEYEAYMKQHDVTYKTEVTTTVVQEPSVVVSQYELEQRRVTTPMSFVSETVRPQFCDPMSIRKSPGSYVVLNITNCFFFFLQEFLISAFEERIIQEIELRIMRITYRELVIEDGELIVTAAEEEAVQPAFDTPVKNYRIMEGMGVIFHCKTGGNPLPKVQTSTSLKAGYTSDRWFINIFFQFHQHDLVCSSVDFCGYASAGLF